MQKLYILSQVVVVVVVCNMLSEVGLGSGCSYSDLGFCLADNKGHKWLY